MEERVAKGQIRIPFDENDKEVKRKIIESIIIAAKVDGVEAHYQEGLPVGSPHTTIDKLFCISFPSVTKNQIIKYNDMSLKMMKC